jgi:hypothetical protein
MLDLGFVGTVSAKRFILANSMNIVEPYFQVIYVLVSPVYVRLVFKVFFFDYRGGGQTSIFGDQQAV